MELEIHQIYLDDGYFGYDYETVPEDLDKVLKQKNLCVHFCLLMSSKNHSRRFYLHYKKHARAQTSDEIQTT